MRKQYVTVTIFLHYFTFSFYFLSLLYVAQLEEPGAQHFHCQQLPCSYCAFENKAFET